MKAMSAILLLSLLTTSVFSNEVTTTELKCDEETQMLGHALKAGAKGYADICYEIISEEREQYLIETMLKSEFVKRHLDVETIYKYTNDEFVAVGVAESLKNKRLFIDCVPYWDYCRVNLRASIGWHADPIFVLKLEGVILKSLVREGDIQEITEATTAAGHGQLRITDVHVSRPLPTGAE